MCTAGCPRNMRETTFFRKILIVAHYIVQNWVSRPNIDDFRHPTWTYYKVFEKMPKKCGKNLRENYFSPLWCLIQKLDHKSGLHAKNQREISSNKVRRLL